MKPTYRTKKWNSLTDFRDYLIKTNKERVIEFDGGQLITDKGTYGLAFGQLSFRPKA